MSASELEEKGANPFYQAFDLLLAKLLAAEEALRVSEATFEHASESQDEWLARIAEGRLSSMMADICDTDAPGYVKHVSSLRWPEREADHLLRAVSDFRTQSYLWAIARGFEHFREFVGAVEGSLPRHEGACPCHLPAWISRLLPRRRRQAHRRFDAMLKRLREAAPGLVSCERRNAKNIPLQQWIRVAAQVRHAVAHSEGVLRISDYERFRSSGLKKHFPGELEADTGYVLKPTAETASKAIRTFREYGVAIYRTVSEAYGFQAMLLGPSGEITTWRR